ncbi:two-component histidine kinase PrrB [Gordonia rhizosphera NBRC 16068]|uniref:histidine kinase n=1 Tax=Gordonia rhizosphera NBRC 16068 TaxID=1108045 RepID=K6VBP6_9ACTN|nr:two-component histidine kinase PrrB [Gordonia rhizosphera NBRC 16068]
MALATAIGALIIVGTLGAFLSLAIERNNLNQLDRQLLTASRLVSLNLDVIEDNLGRFGDVGAFGATIRRDGTLVASTPTEVPEEPVGYRTITLDEGEYRMLVASAGPPDGADSVTISVAAPTSTTRTVTRTQQRRVWLTGLVAIAAASVLGWLFGGRAVRPLARLTGQVGATPPEIDDSPTGARESDELKHAIRGMLDRISEAQRETTAALETARGFAASAAHELRTPLTVMRTDLEVLGSGRLGTDERGEVLQDLLRSQVRVENTLQALENLAAGDLHRGPGEPLDVLDVADEAAADAARRHPEVSVEVVGDQQVPMVGWASGIRLALDNAIANAAKHGQAHRITIAARRSADTVTVTVDDDGVGVDPAERVQVFERFARGSSAHRPGSGLGLALVAQTAELHGGRAYFTDSPLGGARLVIEFGA